MSERVSKNAKTVAARLLGQTGKNKPKDGLRWWAVWSSEYPEEGSLHFRCVTAQEALQLARQDEIFGPDDENVSMDLSVDCVTDSEHRRWLRGCHE